MNIILNHLFKYLPLLILFLPILASSQTIKVKVVGVIDGDTITVLTKENTQKQVRTKGIDAPEKEQDFWMEARQNLTELILDRNVVIQYTKAGKDGQILGTVLLNGKDIGLEMIRSGFAWCDNEQDELLDNNASILYNSTERDVRRQNQGLWQDPNAIPPWEFKKNYKPAPTVQGASINSSLVFNGQVMEVLDGITIALRMANNSRIEVCINRLETPEPGQPFADIAEQHLKDLLLQKIVQVTIIGLPEEDDCLSGDVYLNGLNINLQMVRDGAAWANKKYYYPEGYYTFEEAEKAARNERRGIWQDPSPVPPWIYREQFFRQEMMNSGGGAIIGSGGYGGGSINSGGNKPVRVRGYFRGDGTYVRPHYRSLPNSSGKSSGKKK